MNEIILNKAKFDCSESDLPLLVHYEDKAGGSLFTITLATNLFVCGSKLLFLTGYPMAQEEFLKQVGQISSANDVIFCFKNQTDKFAHFLNTLPDIDKRIIFIKNIDLFEEEIFDLISEKQKIIISGDIDKCAFKDKILTKKFATKIFFSKLENIEIPELEKYQGFLISDTCKGIVATKIV